MPGQVSYVNGVKFPASQVASADANTLDDYEEGTYEAAFACGTSGTITINAGYKTGLYTKVGRQVTVCGYFYVDSVSSPVGKLTITGLPFISKNIDYARVAVALRCSGLESGATTQMQGWIDGNSAAIVIEAFAAGVASDAAALCKAGTTFMVNVTYFTD